MKILIPIFLTFSITLFGQTKEDSLQWQKITEQRILAGKDSVYHQLLRSKKIENYLNPTRLSFSTRPYFTEDSKKLLLEILNDDWMTDEQKLAFAYKNTWKRIDNEIATSIAISNDTIKYSGFSKGRRQHFREHLDSLKRLKTLDVDTVNGFQSLVQFYIKQINERKMPNLYIYTAGMMNDKRFMPILKKMLVDTTKYDLHATKMVLARYRIEPYYEEMLKTGRIRSDILRKGKSDEEARSYQYFEAKAPLFYIMTQPSIKEYAKLLDLEHFDRIDEYDYSIYSVPSRVLADLSAVILNTNFQFFIKKVPLPDSVKKKHIIWVKKWIKENYGNYELNRDYYPGF